MRKICIFLAIFLIFFTVPTLVSVAQTLPALGKHPSKNPLQILATTADTLTARFTLPEIQVRNSHQSSAVSGQKENIFPESPDSPTPTDTKRSARVGESEPTTDSHSSEIYFAGADWTLDVGKPRLPIYTQRIGIPIVGTPIVTVIQARPEIRSVENIRITPDDPIFPALTWPATRLQPFSNGGELLTKNSRVSQGFYPTQLVEAIPVGFVREQRIASLQINPIQYNPATKQLRIFKSVTFRIDFPPFPATGGNPGMVTSAGGTVSAAPSIFSKNSPTFESLFQGTLRNYEQSKPWRSQRRMPYGNRAPGAPILTLSSTLRFKIPVTRTDLYRITYNHIKAAGIEPEDIDLDTVRLESSGQKQGIYVFDENGNNTLDPGEQMVFYGRALADNKFTDENVYWLRFALQGEPNTGIEGSRVEERDATPLAQNLVTPTAFLARVRFEENVHHDVLAGTNTKSELADHYFWAAFRGGNIDTSRKDLGIEVPLAVPRLAIDRLATLRLKFQGASRKGNALHQARISFNGLQLGRVAEWKRQGSQVATRSIPWARVHNNQVNFMRIEALDTNKTPAGSYDFYLDWYEFDYWRSFRAEANRLEFNTNTEPRNRGKVHYSVRNIFHDAIDVYQIDENGITSRLTGGKVSRIGASHQILFEDTVNQYTRYFVISRSAYRSINALVPTPPTPLRNPSNQADYVAITHPDFAENIQPLVEFRRSQGLTTMVVDIGDIYDEFSDGLFNPFAIQRFLRYAYNSWQQPAPTYVVLVGDAHYDYKNTTVEIYRRDPNFRGTYNLYPIFVPTYHGWAPASGETAMDQRFVNISGEDALPDMLIGRLSVQTPEELVTMVEKIINYEKNLKTGLWQGTLIQVADDHTDNPSDGVFEASRNELIQEVIPVGYDTRQIYLRKIKSPERTRAQIRAAINRGALAIEYTGHGGIQTWADEAIFHSEDVVGLRNRYLPFVITTTCLNGQFDKPQQVGNFCLSEQFLLGKYGAIAALSATRLTYGTANAEFDKDLFESLFGVGREPKLVITGEDGLPSTVGHIVADAKISFISRIRNTQWIPGAEQYTLFGDPASHLARPELDIKVELERIALNKAHDIVIKANEVGTTEGPKIGVPGREPVGVNFTIASDFSTESLSAFATFANHFDDNVNNDLVQRTGGRVWKGEYGTIRIDVPNSALPGGGVARVFAYDDTRAAIGGTRFWIDTPVVHDIRETLDIKVTDTLSISVLVVDDKGPAGIRSIKVLWDDTATFKDEIVQMIPARVPLGDVPLGGQWYELERNIPLPQGGRQVRYRLLITDSTGQEFAIPSKTERNIVRVPEGPNIAIGTDEADRAPIRYAFDEEKKGYQLIGEIVNIGGRPVRFDIEVVFAEGNPDVEGDSVIDEDAEIIGSVTIKPTDWVDGTYALQRVTATLDLDKPLVTGVHKIYVLADPDDPGIEDEITGNIQESRQFDNKQHVSFIVNEFNYKPQGELTAFSLDRVFDIHFPANALDAEPQNKAGIPLSVSSQLPTDPAQPDLQFAPIPRVAALRRGLIRQGTEVAQYYEPAFRTGVTTLKKPAELKLRFDVSALGDTVREETLLQSNNPAFKTALMEIANQLAIYAWQADFSAWRRLSSQINYTSEGDDFLLENYVTPTQMENASEQELEASAITINPNLTPAGTWVLLFLDADEYEVFLKRKGESLIQKLDKSGQLDNPFREEGFGLALRIPRKESTPIGVNYTFEFADILAFETDYDPGGDVILTGTWNANLGNGNATVNSRPGPKGEFEIGDWFIFFTDPVRYELLDASGEPVHFPNGVKVRGKVNEPLYLSHLGLDIIVTASSEDFNFGDKVKFSTARVGAIVAEVSELTQFALMRSTDTEPPDFSIWVDGIQPQTGSVIPPRPKISIVLQDTNGIDTEFLTIARQKDGGPLELITDYELRTQGGYQTVPIDYQPILFPGEYIFNITAQDFNGNAIGGDEGVVVYRFFVTETPDLVPPTIDIRVTTPGTGSAREPLDEPLIDGTVLTEQSRFKITLTDDSALDESAFLLNFGSVYETLEPLDASDYAETFDPAAPANADITYAPNLPNGEYQLHIIAADTSENTAELVTTFTLNEEVTLSEVFNVPNPTVDGKTFFTYHLAQAPDTVTIKIYSVNGRLLRTLVDASAKRGTNETRWDGRDETGMRCANGVYLYRVIARTEDGSRVEQVGKLAILR